jgi:D-2-hydroxyacid dehydrogenase (NADP+)
VVAAPITASTCNLINSEHLRKSIPTLASSTLGPLVDERALVYALRERQIGGGAARDVFKEEPLSRDSGLGDLENLLITPHTAGLTEKLWGTPLSPHPRESAALPNHEPLLAIVDKKKGY